MKGIGLIFLLTLFTGFSTIAWGQAVTSTPDSISVNSGAPVAPKEKTGMSKPNRAALYSAILPGAGQFYNKHYWKVPVVYVVGSALTYFITNNHRNYTRFRRAHALRKDGDTTTVDEYAALYPSPAGDAFIENSRDFYRRNRDLSIILAVVAYGMNIIEANVGAHLNDFDISDDLSLNIKPNVLYVAGSNPAPALSLTLQFKK